MLNNDDELNRLRQRSAELALELVDERDTNEILRKQRDDARERVKDYRVAAWKVIGAWDRRYEPDSNLQSLMDDLRTTLMERDDTW